MFVNSFTWWLSFLEWSQMVASRKQRAGESALEYVLEKLQLCRLSPMTLDDVQIFQFLINGFNGWEHAAILTAAMPATVNNFLERVRDLERFGIVALIDTVQSLVPPVHTSSFVLLAYLCHQSYLHYRPYPLNPSQLQFRYLRCQISVQRSQRLVTHY